MPHSSGALLEDELIDQPGFEFSLCSVKIRSRAHLRVTGRPGLGFLPQQTLALDFVSVTELVVPGRIVIGFERQRTLRARQASEQGD